VAVPRLGLGVLVETDAAGAARPADVEASVGVAPLREVGGERQVPSRLPVVLAIGIHVEDDRHGRPCADRLGGQEEVHRQRDAVPRAHHHVFADLEAERGRFDCRGRHPGRCLHLNEDRQRCRPLSCPS